MHKLLFAAVMMVHQALAGPGLMADGAFARGLARFSLTTSAGPAAPRPEAFRLGKLVTGRYRTDGRTGIAGLAAAYGTNVKSIQSTNRNEFIILRPGTLLRIHNKDGQLYEIRRNGQTLNGLLRAYKPGDRQFRRLVVEQNGFPPSAIISDMSLPKGMRILLPGVYVDFDTFNIPFLGGPIRVSSSFGSRVHPLFHQRRHHNGCDIPKPLGTPVYAARSGVVTFAGWSGGYGNLVEIKHKDGYVTRYGHLGSINVKVGEVVEKRKSKLGAVGMTGWTTGPHLHFEIRTPAGKPINPFSKIGRG